MNDLAAANGRGGPGAGLSWAAPMPCGNTPPGPAVLPPEPTTEQIDDVEAAALLRAFAEANASLGRAHQTLQDRSKRMLETWHAARHTIEGVTRFTNADAVGQARSEAERVAQRHADDGPENRLRRRVRPTWLVWPALAASAVFDAAFVGVVVQQMLDFETGSIAYYLAYLPGAGMAIALYVAGTMLAENLFRHRDRSSRRPTRDPLTPWTLAKRVLWQWRPEPEERKPSDLPWPRLTVPVVFAALVLGLLGVFGYIRAALAVRDFPELARVLPVFVILLLLLSLSTVALKVLVHNPYADRAAEVGKAVRDVEKRAADLQRTAHDAVAAHTDEWNTYRALVAGSEAEAHRVLQEGCARILDERGRRARRGTLRLPLDGPRWPAELWRGEPGGGPRIDWALLGYARDLVGRNDPELLERDLAAVVAAQNAQFRRAEPAEGFSPGPR
ncbi:hypothetical protein [Cryptosporangium aurantiacum]|uniref:Uncharacterized protein n=1 Tax=Cryptosporangium aurantiacum TaxID=134849 RepID=A0A1M7K2R6_9ACTN|nr:hypothetical protein [Cryptosporangium aurantiacum]SHM59556.1 hypothetical protein SAMN05443668_101985 [Cryptosporangium aurantiacum]